MNRSSKAFSIAKVSAEHKISRQDLLAIEEPLEIRLGFGGQVRNISVTMRTPGNDEELALGFLYTEGIIKANEQVTHSFHPDLLCATNSENIIQVNLKPGVMPTLQNTERNFYTTSSCGVCGKASIQAIKTTHEIIVQTDQLQIDSDLLKKLPELLRAQQAVFEETGGLHASALFNSAGELLILREDVGRHNALDKVIGAALNENLLPLNDHILLLSGRASFELVQKAVMAGIRVIAAVGAPSSLAVELAQEFGVTLVGFLRGERFNIYSAKHRINIPRYENTY